MTKVFSSETLLPVGLVITIIAVTFAIGISFAQIEANAEDNDAQDAKLSEHETVLKEMDRGLNRGLILQENLNTLQAQQTRTQERLSEVVNGQQQQILRLEILIERLSEVRGTP